MGKTVKSLLIAAVVIGVSFLIPPAGIAIGTATITSGAILAAGVTMALSTVAMAAFGPKMPKTQMSRLNVSLDPSTPRKAVFGTTAMPLDLRYHESSGTDQEYVDYIIAVAAHKVSSITEIWFEEKQAWTLAGGVTGTYSGYLTVTVRTEGTAGNYIPINGGTKWGSSRRLTGCAYLHLRIKRTGLTKKAESPLVSGLPSRVTVIGDGALLYDPRKDSTVPGGSGSHRATDQSTWGAYTNADDTDNPALQLLWWLLGWEINGKLSVGCGVPYTRIDMESFITAANTCDENVTLAIGGTQKRYRTSGTASDADDRMEIINNLLASMNGTLRDNGGKLTITAMKNDLSDYVLTFNEGDMLGDFDWQQTRGLTENYNIARGRYVDPSANSLYQMVDYPEVGFAAPDGIERVMSLDLPYVEDGRRAQRIAKQVLQRNQYRGMFSTTFNAKALGCQVGDVVRVSLEALGWSNKLFRVVSQEIRFDGQVPMALVEENAAIYAWDANDVAPITPTAPTIYDPLNSPFILGIEQTFDLIAKLDDDGILTIDEKIRILIPKAGELESSYQALFSIATTRAISTTNVNTKRTAWLNVLAAITPAWNNIAEDSPVVRNSLDTALQEYVNELELLNKAVAEYTTRNVNRGEWSGSSVSYIVGDFVQRNGSSYSVIIAHTSTALNGPPGANWALLASQGATGATGPTGPAGADGSPGAAGTAAITGYLTSEAVQLFAYANGGVVSYTPATGSFKVFSGNTDVSSSFSLSTLSNPQALTVGYVSQTYSVTSGFDANEDTATLTIRATGSGTYAGITLDKVFSLSKAKGGYEIVATLPSTNLFEGRIVFLTTDDKLYRYTGSAWTAAVPAVDITGQITATQITDGAISTPKLAANAVTASQIAANTITAGQMAANAITANAIAAGAITAAKVGTNEIIALSANIKDGVIETAKIGDLQVTTLKIGGNAVTVPVTYTGTNAFISSAGGAVTVLEMPSFLTVGDATDGGVMAVYYATFDGRYYLDSGQLITFYADYNDGFGYQFLSSQIVGTPTTSGNTYPCIPVALAQSVSGIQQVKFKITVQVYNLGTGGTTNSSYHNDIQLCVLGVKR